MILKNLSPSKIFLKTGHDVIFSNSRFRAVFFRMRLFCPFTQDRHRKVTGPCWYNQELCSEKNVRISDPNETRSETERGPKKGVLKIPGKHFPMLSRSFETTFIFAPYKTFFLQNFSKSRNQGTIP